MLPLSFPPNNSWFGWRAASDPCSLRPQGFTHGAPAGRDEHYRTSRAEPHLGDESLQLYSDDLERGTPLSTIYSTAKVTEVFLFVFGALAGVAFRELFTDMRRVATSN